MVIDVNIPVHAVNLDSPVNTAVRKWWDDKLSGSQPVYLSWTTIIGFIRVSTNSRIFENPLSAESACEYVDSWLQQPCVENALPQKDHWRIVQELLRQIGTAVNLTTDAHLAALAIEYGCPICSLDADFEKFTQVEWYNPLKD